MKLKAAIADGTPTDLVDELNHLGKIVLEEVVGPHLHRNWGNQPAQFYVQNCDFGDPFNGLFCEVRLTGVSRTNDRSEDDFHSALERLTDIYHDTIASNLPSGQRMQLMVTIMVDPPPSLFESEVQWVSGEA